ncbi:MAG: hypothetical protein JSV04_13380 [Candidatus Heimdallarchaeota archaeon]|nr:MAG: hypothetical protein JSV04_13380 [Candidatus Heimdallarchaeota archaeon]
MEQIESFSEVGGKHTTSAATPHEFYITAHYLIKKYSEDSELLNLFNSLTKSENVVSRAMGLYCLAHVKVEKSVPTLKQHLEDPEQFSFIPYGCIMSKTSLGAFILGLLHNKDWLSATREMSPLLPEHELLRLDLETLVKEDMSDRFVIARNGLKSALEKKVITLDIDEIASTLPDLPLSTVFKGLGTLMDENQEVRVFLQECLEDNKINSNTQKIIDLILKSDK